MARPDFLLIFADSSVCISPFLAPKLYIAAVSLALILVAADVTRRTLNLGLMVHCLPNSPPVNSKHPQRQKFPVAGKKEHFAHFMIHEPEEVALFPQRERAGVR